MLILGLYRDNGKEDGSYYIIYWDYIGVTKGFVQSSPSSLTNGSLVIPMVLLSSCSDDGPLSPPEPRHIITIKTPSDAPILLKPDPDPQTLNLRPQTLISEPGIENELHTWPGVAPWSLQPDFRILLPGPLESFISSRNRNQ